MGATATEAKKNVYNFYLEFGFNFACVFFIKF